MTRSTRSAASLSPILFALAFGAYAPAAQATDSAAQHDHAADHAADTAATHAMSEAMARMRHGMAIEPSGDADVDFARGMIPHHEGAIDMAREVLEHGDDPQIRHLAEQVIEAQQSEIRFLQDWLSTNAPSR
ncbi:CopM family metallochaperone [Paracoccus salsus]|uniref:CopM family metallochaperone n=1 Tax=Paracoccus salsus TaxID=2911061 RepID=UPI001F2D0C1F|nr:DUF305 domain-containing protein [Paracoccus salsus]MCF3972710.1 DUF305 domain-containing protein [Paracoccus salsus]